jgi:hypothetical protein
MISSNYLEYEVALLLAKYGKNAVLHALATKMQLSQEQLELVLKEMPSKKPGSRRPTPPLESIDQIIQEHPEKASFLRALQRRFQSRTFLPELRDVRRFFERHSRNVATLKSRADSSPRLFQLLAELDLPELEALCLAEQEGGYSSLGVIADEILRQHK